MPLSVARESSQNGRGARPVSGRAARDGGAEEEMAPALQIGPVSIGPQTARTHSTMKLPRLAAILGALVFSTAASAQTAGPAARQPPAPARPTAPRRPQPQQAAPGHIVITVRDQSGTPLAAVKVVLSGPQSDQGTTGSDGTVRFDVPPPGTYRLRFEREGFITLERELGVRGRQTIDVEVALNLAPPPPPPPTPPPPPPPSPAATAPSGLASAPSGPPIVVSIPEFVNKHYIGREPLKESVLGCLADSMTRVLQLHQAVAEHTHADLDEIIYVIAGEGSVRLTDRTAAVTPGFLAILPHGQPHALAPRGRNPLIVLSILNGAECRAGGSVSSAATELPH